MLIKKSMKLLIFLSVIGILSAGRLCAMLSSEDSDSSSDRRSSISKVVGAEAGSSQVPSVRGTPGFRPPVAPYSGERVDPEINWSAFRYNATTGMAMAAIPIANRSVIGALLFSIAQVFRHILEPTTQTFSESRRG